MIVRLYNAGDGAAASIRSGLLHIEQAWLVDLFENPLEALAVEDGTVTIQAPQGRVTCVKLSVRVNNPPPSEQK
jgi:hypothetical protein